MNAKVKLVAEMHEFDLSGRFRSHVDDALLEAHRAGFEAARLAAMDLCRAEADRQERCGFRSRANGLEVNVRIFEHAEDTVSSLVEDIKRMPYPEGKA